MSEAIILLKHHGLHIAAFCFSNQVLGKILELGKEREQWLQPQHTVAF